MSETKTRMFDAWTSIRKWFEINLPANYRNMLNWGPPASEPSLNELAKVIRRKLPPAFRETYLLYDGIDCTLFERGYLMSIEQILRALEIKQGLRDTIGEEGYTDAEWGAEFVHCEPAIKRRAWIPRWVPFTDSGSGDHLCIDLDPTEHGVSGQIIYVSHETGPGKVVASSFEDLVIGHANDLDRGEFRFDEDASEMKRVAK